MQKSEELGRPAQEVMVRLLEEDIWAGYPADTLNSIPDENDENTQYLREKVFPTLVPALNELATRQQKFLANPTEERYGATDRVDPVTWMAHYLLRNNALHNESYIGNHPYSVVNDVARIKLEENRRAGHYSD